jgi:hypothetical protein
MDSSHHDQNATALIVFPIRNLMNGMRRLRSTRQSTVQNNRPSFPSALLLSTALTTRRRRRSSRV